jgi:hypothetical protein
VGADRKGPLAAFIVVAIIAAILLITSVRSQAATGWLGRAVPSTPEVVHAVGGGFGRMVEQGTILVQRTSDVVARADAHHPGARGAAGSASSGRQVRSAHAGRTRAGHGHVSRVPSRRGHQGTTGHGHPDHGRAFRNR